MVYMLEFVQDERINTIGVFQSKENAIKFLESIPFLHKREDQYGTDYYIHYRELPDQYMIEYNGWRYVLSRFSYSSYESAGDIEAVLRPLCELDLAPKDDDAYVETTTCLDAYDYCNCDIAEIIRKRERFYQEATEYFRSRGRKIGREGLGSQDGEYVLVSEPENPENMHLVFLLDPQTIYEWEEAGDFDAWIKKNRHIL